MFRIQYHDDRACIREYVRGKGKMCKKNSKHHLFGTFWDDFTANRLKSKAKIPMLNTGRKTV